MTITRPENQTVEDMMDHFNRLLDICREKKDFNKAIDLMHEIYFDFMNNTINHKFYYHPWTEEEISEIARRAMERCVKFKDEKRQEMHDYHHGNYIDISKVAKQRKQDGERANRGKEIRHWYYTRTGGGQSFTEWLNTRLDEVESRVEFGCLKAEVRDMLQQEVIGLSEADHCYKVLQKFALHNGIDFK